MNKHKCKLPIECFCSISALEPEDECPKHGHYTINKCIICGKFVKKDVSRTHKLTDNRNTNGTNK